MCITARSYSWKYNAHAYYGVDKRVRKHHTLGLAIPH
jgi:hypothetical protein